MFGDHVEVFRQLEDHAVENGADLFQIVFQIQLMTETVKILGEIHVADDHGVGEVKETEQVIHQISRYVDPDLFVWIFGGGEVFMIGEFRDQVGISLSDRVILAVASDMPNTVGDVFQNIKIPLSASADTVGGVGIGDPHQLNIQKRVFRRGVDVPEILIIVIFLKKCSFFHSAVSSVAHHPNFHYTILAQKKQVFFPVFVYMDSKFYCFFVMREKLRIRKKKEKTNGEV